MLGGTSVHRLNVPLQTEDYIPLFFQDKIIFDEHVYFDNTELYMCFDTEFQQNRIPVVLIANNISTAGTLMYMNFL